MAARKTKPLVVISMGCPSGIGPEVSVAAAARAKGSVVIVGDIGTLLEAALLVRVPERTLEPFHGSPLRPGSIGVLQAGPALRPAERRAGKPGKAAGAAQLAAVEAAYRLVKRTPGSVLVTAPVSKAAIAASGAPGARRFKGHTEWLQELDGAKTSVMCFVSSELATSLVTTHVPLSSVPSLLTPARVGDAAVWLARLLMMLGKREPHLAVASLNPHAGEGELFGTEERRAIAPGIVRARRRVPEARFSGPIGAETAFRKARAGAYDGVVALYHDQATIPMKLVAFGEAVNVTMGLSVSRTSVDHGTAYDIAWRGKADSLGMQRAIELAVKLGASIDQRKH